MHSYQQYELIQFLQQNSNITLDSQLIGQLYKKCIADYNQCTIPLFEQVYKEALQLLGQKVNKSKSSLEEEKDNLLAIEDRLKNIPAGQGKNTMPMRLFFYSTQVLNLQVHNKFMVGQYAFYMKIEDYFEYQSDFKASYSLQFQLNQSIDILDVGDSILLALNTNTENQMKTTIVIPAYSLQIGKPVIEVLTQKDDGELLEIEIQYEIKVLDVVVLKYQLTQAKNLVQSYIKKFQDELDDYELQLQDLRQIKIPAEVSNEMGDGVYQSRQEPSHNTYTIGVPDYYNKPLELQSAEYQVQEKPKSIDIIYPFLLGMALAAFSGIVLNTFQDASFLAMLIMLLIKDNKMTCTGSAIVAFSWVVFGFNFYFYFLQVGINTQHEKIAWIVSGILQVYKIYLILL